MDLVKLRNINFGDGDIKIGVPLVGTSLDELKKEAQLAYKSKCDFAEWRCDFFDRSDDVKAVIEAIKLINKEMKSKPLIFSFRTQLEGGRTKKSIPEILLLYKTAILTKCVDCVDIELLLGDSTINNIVKHAVSLGCKVMISNHDQNSTADKDILIKRIKLMKQKGADLIKVSCTPKNAKDVDTAIEVAKEVGSEIPLCVISQGALGQITRIDAGKIGCSFAYGYVDKQGADGQIEISEYIKLVK